MPKATITSARRTKRARAPLCRLLACCLLPALLLDSSRSDAGPRDVVDQVASFIENNYFDARRAQQIAAALRAAERTGEFDALTEPRDLAASLTQLLRPLDRHLRVLWSPDVVRYRGSGDPRSFYGIRSVQILPGGVGYIELTTFADLAAERRDDPARRAADAALQLTAGAPALIIDLRDNIGGSLDMAGYLISAFVPANAALYDVIHLRDGTQSDRPGVPYPDPRLQVPLYVLTSARTASAAEAFAYTLQAAGRAVIVGDVTAGAANPGGSFPLGEGLSLFVPVGTPVNPLTHTNWEGTGVIPNERIDPQRALEYAERLALRTVLESHPDAPQAGDARRALEALRVPQASRQGPPLSLYRGTYDGVVVSIEGTSLTLHQGRRIPVTLTRLRGDVFFDRDAPSRRIIFERDSHGAIAGIEMAYANGHVLWFARSPPRVRPLQLSGVRSG